MAKRTRKSSASSVASAPTWQAEALPFLQAYQDTHVQAFCSLPDLYANIAAKHGVTIGEFHDGIRTLVQEGRIRLHPFSGSRFALEREEYALVMHKEIMYYVEATV